MEEDDSAHYVSAHYTFSAFINELTIITLELLIQVEHIKRLMKPVLNVTMNLMS